MVIGCSRDCAPAVGQFRTGPRVPSSADLSPVSTGPIRLPPFITATFMSGRLPSAVAIRTIPTRGNGAAAFILVRFQANIRAARLRPSTRPTPISNLHGECFYQNAPRPIFRHGVIREISPRENMRCGMLVRNFHRTSGNPASHAAST